MAQKPVYSMTGFASLSGVVVAGRSVALSVKAVNHRHLDLQVRLPMGMDALEAGVRRVVKAAVRRGHVELMCVFEKESATPGVEWNEGLVEQHLEVFRQAAERFGLKQEADLNAILRLPGVMGSSGVSAVAGGVDLEAMEAQLATGAALLVERFNAARAVEGCAMAAELRGAMERLGGLTAEARSLRVGVAEAELAKLKAKMRVLLETDGVSEDRLMAEAGLLATRSDVEEELVRLETHGERFTELLDDGGELGRQLDFLLQEMNREANTLMSKTGSSSGEHGLRLTEVGLQMKVELERAREQVQNLE